MKAASSAAARTRIRTSSSRLPGGCRGGTRGPVWGTKHREQKAANTSERHENRRVSKGRVAKHHVRDVGVAGSNPATPTRYPLVAPNFYKHLQLLSPGAPTAAALERSNPPVTFARTSHA